MAACGPQTLIMMLVLMQCKETIAWGNDELEMFDLAEEIDQSFYAFFDIAETASAADVRRAYRRLSLQYHPDKNQDEDTSEQFRKIAAVYEILKDEQRRIQYNQILVNGLPDWKQTVFYYRRVRKLGVLELFVLLLTLLTVAHFLLLWSIHLEKWMEMRILPPRKKKDKRGRKAKTVTEVTETPVDLTDSLVRPRILDLWPCKLASFLCFLFCRFAQSLREWRTAKPEIIDSNLLEAEEMRLKRKQKVYIPDIVPEMCREEAPVVYTNLDAVKEFSDSLVQRKTGMWTWEEMQLLTKAVVRFPAGTLSRWEKVAEMVGRSVTEVTSKAKEIKATYGTSVDHAIQGTTGSQPVKMKKGMPVIDPGILSQRIDGAEAEAKLLLMAETTESSEAWTQNQQKILEWALTQYPRGTGERWEKVAEHIPGKSKNDCMARFKYLRELVLKRKEKSS